VQEWRKFTPVLAIVDSSRGSGTSNHSAAGKDEEEKDDDFEDSGGILDFGEDSVGTRMNGPRNQKDNGHYGRMVSLEHSIASAVCGPLYTVGLGT
jgi:hypothetical protein